MPTPSKSELQKRLSALEQERSLLRAELAGWEDERGEGTLPGPAVEDVRPEIYILDKAEDGIFTLDQEGRFRYVNPAGSRMLGGDQEALLSQRVVDVLGRDGQRQWAEKIGEWIQDPQRLSPQLWVEISSKNKLGTQRWLSMSLSWSVTDGRHRDEVHGIIRDITDQKRLELALRQSEEHYRGIIENMDLGILEVDKQERITRAFPKFCAIVGYSEEELLGQKASEILMTPADRERMEIRTEARSAGESELYESQIRNKQGEVVWLLISGVPLRNEAGESIGSMGIHYDITERKKDEEKLKKAMRMANAARRAERRFLAKMSHEIRTPLNAIIGMSHLLLDTPLSAEQSHHIEAISQGGTLLKGLLDGVLDIARLEEGRQELNKRPSMLRPTFEGIMVVYRTLLRDKGVALELEWNDALNVPLSIDVQTLSQVLLNLVGNAAKFTKKGFVRVSPELVEWDGKLMLRVRVADSGQGIPEETIPRVFERFVQAEERKGSLKEGSGLGLAICRELCALHGGSIAATSQLDQGSTFTFEFEVEHAEIAQAPPGEGHQKSIRGLRVLCVEDNAINLMYVQKLLTSWGVAYKSAGNGVEALALFEKEAWDVVLMDVQMPVMNGFEATRAIRQREQEPNRRTPIVGITAFAFEKDEEEGMKAGMDAYLKKPYLPKELFQVLLEWSQA